jgi:hypothetical protein
LTIVLHIWLAGAGAYIFARRSLGLSRWAAWLGAATFALGGYLGAQVEHVNQLQALAWLPCLFTFFDLALECWRWGLALATVVSVQLLAGHSQSVFISLVGLGIYALWPLVEGAAAHRLSARNLAQRLGLWLSAAMVGALLAAAQLVPTLELAGQSMRAGGLTWREAVSFSLSPALLLQALLPNFRQTLFSEYVAYIGMVGLALMAVGVWTSWRAAKDGGQMTDTIRPLSREAVLRRSLSVLALLGVLFALGGYNRCIHCSSSSRRVQPFRVPARWFALYAFGARCLSASAWIQSQTGCDLI